MNREAPRQVVAFHLGAEVYGLDIGLIHTVIRPEAITPVPKTPAYMLGVMNLRGRIIPILDLKARFGLNCPSIADPAARRIIIVETEKSTAGLVVDAVSEVISLPATDIQEPTSMFALHNIEYITGIGRVPDPKDPAITAQLILLFDVQRAVSPEDVKTVAA